MAPTLDHMAGSRNHFSTAALSDVASGSTSDQLCPVAAALDVVGDTWALLLVRDLLWHGPQTTDDLAARNGSLSREHIEHRVERLRSVGLIAAVGGVGVGGEDAFDLTELGRGTEPVVQGLFGFGMQVIRRRPLTAEMIGQLVVDAATDLHDEIVAVDQSAVVGLDVSGRTMSVVLAPGILRADADADLETDVTAKCTQDVFIDLLSGVTGVAGAVDRGELDIDGAVDPVLVLFDFLRRASSH